MKKVLCWLFFIIISLINISVLAAPDASAPKIESAAAILVQEGSGRVLFEKNADEKLYPASTTKMMTALLAVENLELSATLSASETAIDIDRDGSNMGILRDELLTVEQLLYGLLVCSANDAANVLAEAVAGDIDSFIALMNQRAQELGMTNTHFMNAHGYHDSEHYTTARDLMTLAMTVMENDMIRTIVATPVYRIPPTNRYEEERVFSTNNALVNNIKDHRYVYEGAKGIKTGHTSDAGYCLASYAERNGLGFFCVTMKGEVDYEGNDSFIDTRNLFDYAFKEFAMVNVADTNEIVATHDVKWAKADDQAVLSAVSPLEVLLPKRYDSALLTNQITMEEKIVAPVKKGDVLGKVEYFYDGEAIGSVDLAATKDVRRSISKMIFQTLWRLIFNAWVMVPLGIIVLILILRSVNEAKKQRREREKRRQQFRRDFYR